MKKPLNFFKILAISHSIIYLITGLWPLVSINSFQKITGPKVDLWLVKTVGILTAVIGFTVGAAGIKREKGSPELRMVAAGGAAGLAGIDLIYVMRKRISPVYLLDALAEAGLIAGWVLEWVLEAKKMH